MVEAGFRESGMLRPIFDEFDRYGVKFALEVHPGEIAFDYWTFKLLETSTTADSAATSTSHLWQMVDPCMFLEDFIDRVYHVPKDCKLNYNGRNGCHRTSPSATCEGAGASCRSATATSASTASAACSTRAAIRARCPSKGGLRHGPISARPG